MASGDERTGASDHVKPGSPAIATPATQDSIHQARAHAIRGQQLFEAGKPSEALKCFKQAAALHPHPVYHFTAGTVAWRLRMLDLAGEHLREAVRIAPNYPAAREALSQWYLEQGRDDLAVQHSHAAVALAPQDAGIALSHAFALADAGQVEEAWTILEPQLQVEKVPARAAVLFGRIARWLGKEPDAVSVIERVLARPEPMDQRPHLHFVSAKLLDRMGQYDRAFVHATAGHDAARRPYDPRYHTLWTDRRIEFYTRERLRSLPRATHGSRRPVFIVGMPRSGTSLVEQILSSHPQVFGAGELSDMDRIAYATQQAAWAAGKPYPLCLQTITTAGANELAQQYLATLSRMNASKTYVTDKMPVNFMWLGLIQILLPDCHVIHCTRNPMDSCLSCYMTNFNVGNDFAQDLTHLGLFYKNYRRLMDHWRQVLDLPVLEVSYESLVADLEGQSRRLLSFLDLPWDDRCLRFHENDRRVATASREQVRRPLYASSVGRWKHYESHLRPLVDALGEFASPPVSTRPG